MTDQPGPDTAPAAPEPPQADTGAPGDLPESMLRPISGAFLDDVDEPAQADTDARETLRDQIEAAILAAGREVDRNAVRALMPVVEAAIERAEQRYKGTAEGLAIEVRDLVAKLGQAEQRANTWHAAAQAANASTHAAEVRAGHAEDERDTWRAAAEQAEAAVQRMRDLLDSYPPGSNFARSGAQALFRRVLDQEAGQ